MSAKKTIDILYDWFSENREKIIKKHENKFVLITKDKGTMYFNTEKEALDYTQANAIQFGTFIVQSCITEEEDTMMYFNQAVLFG